MLKHRTKQKRSFGIDMIAMSGFALVLLAFLIFTYQPRNLNSPVAVKAPLRSTTCIDCFIEGHVTVLIRNNKVFLDIADPELKRLALMGMSSKYRVPLSDNDIKNFMSIGNFGDPISGLRRFLQLYNNVTVPLHLNGIPINDSKDNEFSSWIEQLQHAGNNLYGAPILFAIVGDQQQAYGTVKTVISNLQDHEVNKFSIVYNNAPSNTTE